MKSFIVLLFLLPICIFAKDIDVNQISKKIDVIKNSTKITAKLDYDIYDPFATAKPILKHKKKKKTVKKRKIHIKTILNNRVFINRRWYNVGEIIYGYKIKSINSNYIVVLKHGERKRVYKYKKKNFIHTKELIK